MMNSERKIAIVDDDQLVVSLLTQFFSKQPGLGVVFTASNGQEFLNYLTETDIVPDAVLLDLKMNEMDGITTMEKIREAKFELKIIVLSSYYQPSAIGFMLKSGACAFQPKGLIPDQLLDIVHEVLKNGFYFSPEQVDMLKKLLPEQQIDLSLNLSTALTKREVEVLELICRQKTNKEIANELFISQRTVEGHRTSLLLKTGVKNTAGLVIFAVQNRLVDVNALPLLS